MTITFMERLLDVMTAGLAVFIVSCILRKNLQILQKLYVASTALVLIWIVAVIGILEQEDAAGTTAWFLDAITCAASGFVVLTLFNISYIYTKNVQSMPRLCRWLYCFPVATSLLVFTNPLHHLFYRVFSTRATDIEYGPLFFVSGGQYYFWCLLSILVMVRYAWKNRHRLVIEQTTFYCVGLLIPLGVNIVATLRLVELSIAATPMAFFLTILCHGYAIYFLNFMNIKPVAFQNIMDSISDGYVILSSDTCIVNANQTFLNMFGEEYGLKVNDYLNVIVDRLEERKKDLIYNLLNFFDVCRQSTSVISYEQAVLTENGKRYYSVELTPVFIRGRLGGVIALFENVTSLKEEMQKEKENLSRELERQRLASLGQMIGSISHSMKTPIMAISGSTESLDNLVTEYETSIGDEEVTEEDHREIAGEMRDWIRKIRDSSSYMSDVITTVKGMAANLSTSVVTEFEIEAVFKKVQILMKQSLLKYRCHLIADNHVPKGIFLKGDVNNLVQVLTNLVDNAKDAMLEKGGDIVMKAWYQEGMLYVSVTDSGTGIAPEVKERLFETMYTTKGTRGTGLGLYSSAGLIRGKFGGNIWIEDNPSGGTAVYMKMPAEG